MRHFRKTTTFLIALSLILAVGCSSQGGHTTGKSADYPKKTITGVIPWGAGGDTDSISRAIAPLAEKHLGQSIVLSNKTGANGAIGLQYVVDKNADGYHAYFSDECSVQHGSL
ncbi:tripartite tricarboxylate transporter substrate-binding protein [Brevibacillus invocatus]|uniref:tripartite tricarboxylate transporter substrate-binding protein n=1 Tax=Brevibacillus invocatus TaxID=173959 RepID=UPI00203F531A|nr:tripartite tricarboxylate transporter substrate-binding protein [Brevibacillus invocatus]MCM3078282.1 tripartite tricarboxylate transporter substrate-binding protein [Brevibacillus invocatus]MCM3428563.1 tripartite tricarboxylate transporter substrate-binding protein [Brevibacillus invocatus]